MPRTPAIMSALQEGNLPLQPRRERLHRAGSFCAGDLRRMPASVRLRTRIVIRKIVQGRTFRHPEILHSAGLPFSAVDVEVAALVDSNVLVDGRC